MRVSLHMQYAKTIEAFQKQASDLDNEVEEIWAEKSKLRELAYEQRFADTPEDYFETRAQIEALQVKLEEAQEEARSVRGKIILGISNNHRFFLRPEQGFAGMISRPLGAVPQFMPALDPRPEKLAEFRSHRLTAFLLFLCAASCLVTLVLTVPWLAISPAILTLSFFNAFMPPWHAVICTVCVGAVFVRLLAGDVRRPIHYSGKFLDNAAMHEEQWFRSGAEAWSTWRRVYSCVAFGLVHLSNFIYPIASLLVVGALGGVFMAVYLREYRRSGSYEQATIASTKLHAAYNRFALLYVAVALCALVAIYITTW